MRRDTLMNGKLIQRILAYFSFSSMLFHSRFFYLVLDQSDIYKNIIFFFITLNFPNKFLKRHIFLAQQIQGNATKKEKRRLWTSLQ